MVPFLTALLLSVFVAWGFASLELRPWRRAADAHWSERARLLFPARVFRAMSGWLIPLAAALIARIGWPETPLVAPALGGFVGAMFGGYPMDREIVPGLSFRTWIHLALAGIVLSSLPWAVLIAAAISLPAQLGWKAWSCVTVLLVFHLARQFGLTTWLLRSLRLLRPAGSRLTTLLQAASAAAPVRVRAAWELIVPEANAMVFITTRDIFVTSTLLAAAPDDEIKAIIAHELGHLSEHRLVIFARVIGALVVFPLIFVRPVSAGWGWKGVVALGLITAMLWLLSRRLGQAMEKRADRIAVESVVEPATYARALERLYRINQMPAVLSKTAMHVHPNLYDRMLAAGVTPDFGRPEPPSRQCLMGSVLVAICMIAAILLFAPSI